MSNLTADDVDRLRADFPILNRQVASGARLAFLDNAASTQRPTAVIEAISELYRNRYANVHRGIHTLSEEATADYEAARVKTADFVSANSHREVVFCSGTTAAINTVARSWGSENLTAQDTVLLTIAEHHANIVPWQQLAQQIGFKIEFLPLQDDFTISETQVAEALEAFQPKLFAFTAASNVLGTETPVKQWTTMAHEAGATVLVDAAQAAPHSVVDVKDWDAEFVTFSGHKLCGPTGIGVLYGKEAILDSMAPFMGGGAMISEVTTSGFKPAGLPEKFEAGTPPIAEAVGLAAAIDYIQAVGLDRIHEYEKSLCVQADRKLRDIEGVRILGPTEKTNGILSFTIDRVHAHDVAQWLDTKGIAVRAGHHCTMPLHKALKVNSSNRASFYFYNTNDEVERFVNAVEEVRNKFASTGRRRRSRLTQ